MPLSLSKPAWGHSRGLCRLLAVFVTLQWDRLVNCGFPLPTSKRTAGRGQADTEPQWHCKHVQGQAQRAARPVHLWQKLNVVVWKEVRKNEQKHIVLQSKSTAMDNQGMKCGTASVWWPPYNLVTYRSMGAAWVGINPQPKHSLWFYLHEYPWERQQDFLTGWDNPLIFPEDERWLWVHLWGWRSSLRVCHGAGHCPTQPVQMETSVTMLERWAVWCTWDKSEHIWDVSCTIF